MKQIHVALIVLLLCSSPLIADDAPMPAKAPPGPIVSTIQYVLGVPGSILGMLSSVADIRARIWVREVDADGTKRFVLLDIDRRSVAMREADAKAGK